MSLCCELYISFRNELFSVPYAAVKRELTELTIDPQAVDPDDVELLQDMILAAVNEALRAGEETREREMNRVSGGMGGMF